MTEKKRVKLVCPECGSDEVYGTISVIWSEEKQCFDGDAHEPHDTLDCGACFAEFRRAKEIEISPLAEIESLSLQRGDVTKEALVMLAHNDDLEHFQIICHWKNGMSTTGWSKDITHAQLVYGMCLLNADVNDRCFNQENDDGTE